MHRGGSSGPYHYAGVLKTSDRDYDENVLEAWSRIGFRCARDP